MLERRIMPATPAQIALLEHLHSFPRAKLERTIEALIAICDLMDGDADREEDDDPDTSVEDGPEGFDPEEDIGQDDFGEPTEDYEIKQMLHDVPCIPVFALEPNIFNGQRQLLGYALPKPLPNGTMAEEI